MIHIQTNIYICNLCWCTGTCEIQKCICTVHIDWYTWYILLMCAWPVGTRTLTIYSTNSCFSSLTVNLAWFRYPTLPCCFRLKGTSIISNGVYWIDIKTTRLPKAGHFIRNIYQQHFWYNFTINVWQFLFFEE